MSVLIKGMEMPKNCRACRLKMNCDDCEGFECVCLPLHTQIGYLNDLLTDKRRDDCPLAPVPEPHGRLIDETDVIKHFVELANDPWNQNVCTSWSNAFAEAAGDICDMPTIIKAEECK